MSVIGDLDDYGSAAQALRLVAESFVSSLPTRKTGMISCQPARKTSKSAVAKTVRTTKTDGPTMEQSDLMTLLQRPLSPDARVEVPASWAEYDRAQELLDNLGNKYPRLWYDGARQTAIIVAAPTDLQGRMVGDLVTNLANGCNEVMRAGGISEDIRRRLTASTDVTKHRRFGSRLTVREWDGALEYMDVDKKTKIMVVFEVGVSQSYRSLQQAISWQLCSLHCRLGIAMHLHEGPRGASPAIRYYASEEAAEEAIQQAVEDLSIQLQQHPYGPLERNGVTWFGALEKVIVETFRCDVDNATQDTLLDPSQSFVVIRDGQSWAGDVPPNLREVVLGDCIPSYVLSGNEILDTPINFFQKNWVEAKISSAILSTAAERIEKKCRVLESTDC
ncbi:hypothetical protein V1525DRAFT_427389 [Lipomyces kononenkoae]|uniref:Uncharacterized protein n=1 Tax=Lipomyces kononenkoae TaxID=34357 RepID=A0ACC3SWP9_LIPKO